MTWAFCLGEGIKNVPTLSLGVFFSWQRHENTSRHFWVCIALLKAGGKAMEQRPDTRRMLGTTMIALAKYQSA